MEKKSQANYRQGSLSVSKESGANKFVNSDWKRENYNGRFQGNEVNRKHNHTKSNNVIDNRRPRSKGVVSKYQKDEVKKYPSHDADFEECDDVVDVADVFDKNGKQSRNITQVVNFYQQKQKSLRYAGSKAGQKRITRGSNKERFIQANCQFVVKPNGDYDNFVLNPDVFVDWDLVLEVRLFMHELPSCPICLYPPRAAKITKCGHVYCWPCMLHYISLSSGKGGWSKCPICCEPVYSDDLKSVSITEVKKFEPGMQITMKLMSKTRGDTVVAPSSSWQGEENALQSVRDSTSSAYAKLLRADVKYLNEMLENEKLELTNMMKEEEPNSLESTFITLALELNWTTENKELINISQAMGSLEECNAEANSVSELSDATCNMPQTPFPSSALVENQKKLKYFYQAEDGQHIYMHSLNVRCLTAEYSSMEFCPKEIVAVIVDVEEFCMSEDTRQHFNYLSHLPIGCQFKIVELNLLPPLISLDSLKVSEELVKRRRREREMRERRDKKNAAQIQKIHNKMMGYDPESRIIKSDYHKLQDGEVLREELSGSHHFPDFKGFRSDGEAGVGAESLFEKNETDKEGSKLSFAQMLRSGKVKPFTNQPIHAGPAKKDDSDPVEVPDFSSSWNIDLSKKLEETLLSVKQGNTKGGKKNKKGILLFATGAAGPRCK